MTALRSDSIRATAVTLWLVLWSIALAPAAAAQTVPVRSGAHDGFDRLVLDLPERRPWRVVPRDGGASVIFDGAALRFDLGAVFDRIGRQRLRAISAAAEGGRLDLVFACDCRIAPFWHAGDLLVIDIARAPAETAPPPSPSPSPPLRARPRPRPLPKLPDAPALVGASPAGAALAARLDARPGPRRRTLPETTDAAPPGDGGNALRATLGQQLGRAASQGLVTPVPDRQARALMTRPAAPEPPHPEATAAPAIAQARPDRPGLRITTSMDRDLVAPPRPDGGAATCPPVAHLDVPSWGGTRPFAVEVGRLNGRLFGEFDAVQQAEALRLARLYIHYGFGAEARQVLGWLDPRPPEMARARALAALVEGRPLPAGAMLADALGCGEPGVLWAILAMSELPEDAVFDHRALRRAFVALPDGLRRALGPALAQRLLAAGHRDSAGAILRHLRGGDALSDAETGLVRARLATETGDPAAAEEALRDAARSNAAEAGVALAGTIERALARAAPVSFDDAQLAGALAFEHRGTPLGGRLAQAYLSALAASGAFDDAMVEFERLRPSLRDAEAQRVASVLVSYLARQADDITFLRAIMTDRITPAGTLGPDVALAVARRLLALGFPGQAARHVTRARGAWPGADSKARRVLRARIALAQARPAAAINELLGLEGDGVDLLRAEALAARGDHAGAQRLFADHDAARRADRAALHTGRAVAMAQAQEPALREFGTLLAHDAPLPEAASPGGGLSVPRTLLERSTALRGAMVRLLAATPVPADGR